jgi:hypothetical protein
MTYINKGESEIQTKKTSKSKKNSGNLNRNPENQTKKISIFFLFGFSGFLAWIS